MMLFYHINYFVYSITSFDSVITSGLLLTPNEQVQIQRDFVYSITSFDSVITSGLLLTPNEQVQIQWD